MFRLQQISTAEFDQDERKVIVRWTDNTDQEIGTYVERREGTTGNYVQIGNTVADQNVFMDSTFNTETTYYYRASTSALSKDSIHLTAMKMMLMFRHYRRLDPHHCKSTRFKVQRLSLL
ncbi:MAG: hypothetical protein U5K00_01490 [Melioribacteraceae bacterium]|nr:hypothetical protein [Melioribacteraceae bacterium]